MATKAENTIENAVVANAQADAQVAEQANAQANAEANAQAESPETSSEEAEAISVTTVITEVAILPKDDEFKVAVKIKDPILGTIKKDLEWVTENVTCVFLTVRELMEAVPALLRPYVKSNIGSLVPFVTGARLTIIATLVEAGDSVGNKTYDHDIVVYTVKAIETSTEPLAKKMQERIIDKAF